MNRFRVNLHPAFFDPDKLEKTINEPQTKEQLETKRQVDAVKKDVIDSAKNNPEPRKVTIDDIMDVTIMENLRFNGIDNPEQFLIDNPQFSSVNNPEFKSKRRQRFQERLDTYGDKWNKDIEEGYKQLMKSLEENHYFEGSNGERDDLAIAQVQGRYRSAVINKYIDEVLGVGEKKFNKSDRSDIFNRRLEDSIVNKIYTKLTGAASISTVERQFTESYVPTTSLEASEEEGKTPTAGTGESPAAEKTGETDESALEETEIDKNNRKFLSNDLPQYLWDVRKTPRILNVMKRLPIFSVKIDRPSEVDRDAISDFIKAANMIPTKDGKLPEIVLIEALHDNTLNTNSSIDTYMDVLEKHGMDKNELINRGYKQFKKSMSKIMEVGNFYINTQKTNKDVKDQHAIYLSVLGIIEDSKGAENAVNKFRERVEQAKVDKKKEKKEGYVSGEKLGETNPELYGIAKSLGITDFASATRLSELDDEYFSKTPVEKILANLNNDNIIDARDTMAGGLKTGSQFLETFKQVSDQLGKEKALSNLVNHAKLINKTLGVGLPDVLLDPKTIESDIKGGHTGIILLLQNVISNPGEDLYTLLSGRPENPFEGLDLAKESESAKKYASEMISKMDLEALKKEGLNLPTSESMQSDLAGVLFEEYKRGIGLGGKVSFDQWIKGVEMNTGFQIRDGGNVVVGIGLDYHKKINLGKGWSTTPELSAGVFIPLGYGKPDVTGAIGLNDEVAKERITKKGVQQKLGMQAGVTLLIPTGTPVASVGLSWERNKAAGIEYRESELRGEMKEGINDVLNKIYEARKGIKTPKATQLDFGDQTLIDTVKEALQKKAKESGVKEKDMENVVNATFRLLLNYKDADLSNENVRDIIATRVADQYAMAWSEARKAHISKSTYLSGANLGVFRVVGSPLVGVYAGLRRTDHDLDGYGDKLGETHTIDNSKRTEQGVRDVTSLAKLNERLGLTEKQGLVFSKNGDEILVPKSILNRVKVSESMKGLIAKDGNGNVSISPWTTMGESIVAGAATQSRELLIGEGNSASIALDTVKADWFAQNIQEVNKKILTKENVEHFYTPEGIRNAINKLKTETKNEVLSKFNPSDEEINTLIQTLKALPNKDKIAKIIIERQSDGTFKMDAQDGVKEGKGLELEYRAKLEMFDSKAKELANKVYERAASIKNPEALNRVKHPIDQRHPEYEEFVNNLMGLNGKQKDVHAAKNALDKIITKLNSSYKDKPLPIAEGEWPTDTDALEQVLMSINNVFARSKKVKGGESETIDEVKYNKYEFTTNMGDIIAEREKEIGGTLVDKLKNAEEVKNAYVRLMDATAKYRENHKKVFNIKSSKSAHLSNAIGFNLGDQYNPENPLFDPEVYEQTIKLEDLDSEYFTQADKDVLHRRAIENFITKPALFKSIKDALGVDSKETVRIKEGSEFTQNNERNQTIELDIGGKIVKLSSNMTFGYFTQCVNHTVILENIKLEDDKGNVVNFTSGTWENGRYVEGNKTSIVSTTEVGVSASVIVHNGTKPEQPEQSEEPEREVGSDNYNDGLHDPGEPGSTAGQDSTGPAEDPAEVDF